MEDNESESFNKMFKWPNERHWNMGMASSMGSGPNKNPVQKVERMSIQLLMSTHASKHVILWLLGYLVKTKKLEIKFLVDITKHFPQCPS